MVEGNGQGFETKDLSASHCFYMVPQTLFFHLHVNCLLLLRSLSLLFLLFNSEWHISFSCLTTCGPSYSYGVPIHNKLNLVLFPTNQSSVNLIIRQCKELRKAEEKNFFLFKNLKMSIHITTKEF